MLMYPEYTVEVLFVHSQEVAVVLSQNDRRCPRCVIHQSQLPEVISLMQCTNYTLQRHISSKPANSTDSYENI